MEAKEKVLSEALYLTSNEYFYKIPKFQRPYIWDINKHVNVLYDDLYDEYKSFINKGEDEEFEKYFIGPIVLVKDELNKKYDIVDGQQRITTLHILLWYLYRKINDEREKKNLQIILFPYEPIHPRLEVCNTDMDKFLLITSEEEKDIVGNTPIEKCAMFFKKKFENFTPEEAKSFSEFLRQQIQFVVIVSDNYSDAWDLFIGLNYKGEPLNPSDLIKAYVCGNSKNKNIGDIWEKRIKVLGDYSTSFFLSLARYNLKKHFTENNLYKEFSKNFPKSISETDLIELSIIYYLFWQIAIEEIDEEIGNNFNINNDVKRSLRLIRDLKRRDCTSLIYKYTKEYGVTNLFNNEFLKSLASFQMRMSVAGKRTIEKYFNEKFSDIKFENKNNALDVIRDFYNEYLNEDDDFKRQIKELRGSKGSAWYILRELEEGDEAYREFSNFQIEHVMPQTGSEYWYDITQTKNQEEYQNKDIYDKIGNLFPISERINKTIRNSEFPNKKKYYQMNLKDWSITRITKDIEIWNEDEIDKRTNDIAEWAVDRFSL